MNVAIFYSILGCLALFTLFVGKCFTKIGSSNNQAYFLSNRDLGIFPLTLTFLATQLGGGSILGSAEAAYKYGWVAIYYALGLSLGLFILSLGVGAKFRSMQVSTIPEIFGKIYDSKKMQFISSLVLICSMFFILLATGVATRQFFNAIGISNEWLFLGFWVLIILYTTLGGLSAVVRTDILQVSFVLLVFLGVFIFVYCDKDISLLHAIQKNPVEFEMSSLPWINWLFMPMFFAIIGQDMGQRCFAAKSAKIVPWATAGSGVLLILSALLPVTLGILARKLGFVYQGTSVLIELVQQLTNPVMASFFASAILMAILSTADSLLCSISSNVNYDVFEILDISENKYLAKATTFIIGFLAIALSFVAEEVIPIMVGAYELSVCTLFVPIWMAVFAKIPRRSSAMLAFLVGAVSFAVFKFINMHAMQIVCILVGFVVYKANDFVEMN